MVVVRTELSPIFVISFQIIERVAKETKFLSAPAREITGKLNEYFEAAKGKSVYWNAVALDPRIKLSLLTKEKEKREFKTKFKADLEPFDQYPQEVTAQSEEDG